jgi:uncharacterized protein
MTDIKRLFTHYLLQLKVIVSKTPPEIFPCSLSEGMFSLEMHAKIAANFTLRGYCPLLNVDPVSFYREEIGRDAVLSQIEDTLVYLADASDINEFDDSKFIVDKAGSSDIELCQSEFIHLYIFPNFLFHISMVYAIAKANGVTLGKGDFDGFHAYPSGFSFVK